MTDIFVDILEYHPTYLEPNPQILILTQTPKILKYRLERDKKKNITPSTRDHSVVTPTTSSYYDEHESNYCNSPS